MALTKNDLSTNELLVLNLEMNKREKSLVLAYLMLLVGHLGVHRFYLKKSLRESSSSACLFLRLCFTLCLRSRRASKAWSRPTAWDRWCS